MSKYDEIFDLEENEEDKLKEIEKKIPKLEIVNKTVNDGPVELPEGFDGDLYDSDYDDAVQLYSQEKYDEVLAICERKKNANNKDKYIALSANCYYKQGNKDLAIKNWKHAIEINPSMAEPYVNLGNYEYAKGNKETAIKFWITASSIKPESEAVNVNLGVVYGEKGFRYESLKYFDKYLRYTPETNTQKYNEISTTMNYFMDAARAAIEKAEENIRAGSLNKAVQYYMYAIENYPMQAKAPFSLGNIFYNDRNYEKALYYWNICRKFPKIPPQLMLNIAKAYDRLKQYDSAYCYYSRYLPFVSTSPQEYNVVKSRLIQLTVTFSKNPLVMEAHKSMGEEAEKNADYFKAIESYENYLMLYGKDTHELKKKILEYKMFYHPEQYLTGLLINKIEEMKGQEIAEIVIPMCNRIMMFAEPNSKEAMYANTKKNSLIRRGQ